MSEKIKVLIVEDSPTVSAILQNIIRADQDFEVVGVARDGTEAIRMVARLRPNIITMDVNMPQMTGLEATEYIMAHYPTPILVLTAFSKHDVDLSFKMLSAGALEIIEKPDANEWQYHQSHIIDRLKLLSRIKVITHLRGKRTPRELLDSPASSVPLELRPTAPLDPSKVVKPKAAGDIETISEKFGSRKKKVAPAPVPTIEPQLAVRKFKVLAIAASTGGPPALAKLLRDLPENMPVPIFVVQHIPAGFSGGLADWLNGESNLRVKLAEEGERPTAGCVYLPADDTHLTFMPDGRMHSDLTPAKFGLRPSADFTFDSMAKVWGADALAVILTGMGRDGSLGMRSLHQVGAYNVAQDEASCVIFGMPKAAIELGVINKVVGLEFIAPFVKQVFKVGV